MNTVSVLPVSPGSLTPEDKQALREAGVVVIEHAHPESLRLLPLFSEVPQGMLLEAAMQALCDINASSSVRAVFTTNLGAAMRRAKAVATTGEKGTGE